VNKQFVYRTKRKDGTIWYLAKSFGLAYCTNEISKALRLPLRKNGKPHWPWKNKAWEIFELPKATQ